MFHVARDRTMPFPSETVWRYLIDFPNVPKWEDGVLEVRQTSSGAPGVGTTLVARRVYAGRESLVDCRIVDWQDGRSVTMEIGGGPVQSATIAYAVAPIGADRCLVTYTSEVTLKGLLRVMTPFIRPVGERLVDANLERLERRIAPEADAPPPAT